MTLSVVVMLAAFAGLVAFWVVLWKSSFFSKQYNLLILIGAILGVTFMVLAWEFVRLNDLLYVILAAILLMIGAFHIGLCVLKLAQVDTKYRRMRYHNRAVIAYEREHEEFVIHTPDHVRIKGIFLACRHNAPAHKAVIVCHGASRNKNTASIVQTSLLLAETYDVYTFDFRGHMESDGVCYVNGDEIDLDLAAVIQHVETKGYQKIAVFGWSLGGAVVIRTAAKGAKVDAIIASAPAINVSSMSEVRQFNRLRFLGFSAISILSFLRSARLSVHTQSVMIDEFLPKIAGIPILLAFNDYDYALSMSGEEFEQFYERLPQPKDQIRLAGRGHVFDWPQTYLFWQKMLSWLESNL
ncbi:MAG: alpha/beta fold hydrolase [Anaerolineaceae bacterium]|nr:alpha/beta fold hydrolase [Anaerolineaceae bacterium]